MKTSCQAFLLDTCGSIAQSRPLVKHFLFTLLIFLARFLILDSMDRHQSQDPSAVSHWLPGAVIMNDATEAGVPAVADAISVIIIVDQIAPHIAHTLANGRLHFSVVGQPFIASPCADCQRSAPKMQHEQPTKCNTYCYLSHMFPSFYHTRYHLLSSFVLTNPIRSYSRIAFSLALATHSCTVCPVNALASACTIV